QRANQKTFATGEGSLESLCLKASGGSEHEGDRLATSSVSLEKMKIRLGKRGHGYSTAGGRELRLKARPPARLALQSSTQKHIEIKDKETKTTVPSGNSYFWHIESPSYPLPGNSYFWRTACNQLERIKRLSRQRLFCTTQCR